MTNLLPRLEFAVQSLYRSQKSCPYCRSRDSDTVGRKHLAVKIRCCRGCGLCFTDPLYRSSLFGSLYDSTYDAEGSTTALPSPTELDARKGNLFAGTDKDFRDRISRLLELAPGSRLLELGSSWGYFVFQARALGFDAEGVEIGRTRREFGVRALGVPLVESLTDVDQREFHVVYTAHVLEHFTDLTTIFDELHAVLVPGGLLAIEVPHFDLDGRGPAALASMGAVHPLGFTREFFARNLPHHGFEVEGFFDAWDEVLDAPARDSRSSVVIVLARAHEA